METDTYITPENYQEFKREYTKAVEENKATFTFQGTIVLTAYAKYLCAYLESVGIAGDERRVK